MTAVLVKAMAQEMPASAQAMSDAIAKSGKLDVQRHHVRDRPGCYYAGVRCRAERRCPREAIALLFFVRPFVQ